MRKKIRREIYKKIDAERKYQDEKWGWDFDTKNTLNDWISYIARYAGRAGSMNISTEEARELLLKAVAIGVAALEQDKFAPRHYDITEDDTND